jgi:hypothetical protein
VRSHACTLTRIERKEIAMPQSALANTVESPSAPSQPKVDRRRGRAPGQRAAAEFRLRRTDVEFRYHRNGEIDIAFTLVNHGSQPSAAQRGFIEEAPFGAFVPWTPLATFDVPPLRPGQSTQVRLCVPRTSSAGGEPPDTPPVARRRWLFDGVLKWLTSYTRGRVEDADVPRFAGNLNVHIGAESVERHLSGPLRIDPGKLNFARFIVGDGTDSYRFDLRGEAAAWDACLCDFSMLHSGKGEIERGRWYPGRMRQVFLVLHPPAECRQGALEVLVEQRSTGRVAVVEFDLDPQSLGAACYKV